MNIEAFFKGIYCVNLDERVERWKDAIKEFKKLNIENNVKRFSAIKHTNGATGCRESHLNIIKEAKKLNLDNVLIFEDDLLFVNLDLDIISNALDELNELDWDLFYFGATVAPWEGKLTVVSPSLVKTNFAFTTHAYAVNKKIYDVILNNGPHNPIIDVFYCKNIVNRGKSFIINPMMCIQREEYSDIEKRTADYGWMLEFFDKCLKK